jgi:transposase
VHGHDRKLIARHRERYAAVQALRAEGCPVREIARHLGLARGTAAKFASAASIDELLVKATRRPSILDPFKPYLGQRWNDGITSATALHQEIQARGWTGGILTVERYLRQFRTATAGTARPAPSPSSPHRPHPRPQSPVRSPAGS